MTKAEVKKELEIFGNKFYADTCYKLKFEIVRKVMNSKAIPDFDKLCLIEQYITNNATNNSIIEHIKQFNTR
jgi:hypothetical protein